MMRAIGSPVSNGAHFTRGHAVNDRPDAAPCWCGQSSCYDHGDQCARCGWRRARAMLTRVRYGATTVLQCRDGCEGRPSQWD
jgi:hypothetical protein